MVLLYGRHLGDTISSENRDPSGNRVLKIKDLVLSYLHIGLHTSDAKYRI